jgi:hypothetical protein
MKCPKCTTRKLVVIQMVVGGEPVIMQSCSACEWRLWCSAEGVVPLTSVLHKAGRRRAGSASLVAAAGV